MQKILFLTNIPSPYRVEFFNELGKLCELTVLFERHASRERDKSWSNFRATNFKAVFLKGKTFRVDSAICPSVVGYLKNGKFDHIVVTNFSDPTGILAIIYMKLHGIPYEIESDGGFAKDGKGLREKMKKWLISSGTRFFSTAEEHDNYYLQYGAKKERIARYPFTSLHEDDILPAVPSYDEKMQLRREIGMDERFIILSIGQYIYRKGFDLLIKASERLPDNVGIYIVGGKPTDEYLNLKNKYCPDRIHFIDYKLKNELSNYLQASDAFILPTREDIWGLVINEAMANGLPIVTTDKCVAGLELVDKQNGAIIKSDDEEELASSINGILENDEIRKSMAWCSLERIKPYTFENMAREHIKIWLLEKK